MQLDKEDDVNKVLRYFSYEHFYVIYCKVRVSPRLPLPVEKLLLGIVPVSVFPLPTHPCLCLQFWELDADHDFYICKEDLLRYGNHSLTYRIVDRIFSQVGPNRLHLPWVALANAC